MEITITLNGKTMTRSILPDTLLIDFVRSEHCLSVKRGCDTSNCGLCTVWVENKPVLSCSTLAAQINNKHVVTLEGVQDRAIDFGTFLAKEGAEQCGYCSPGFIMNVLAMEDELENPTEREIKEYLAGNLCRCTGYQGQLRAIKKYLDRNKEVANNEVCK